MMTDSTIDQLVHHIRKASEDSLSWNNAVDDIWAFEFKEVVRQMIERNGWTEEPDAEQKAYLKIYDWLAKEEREWRYSTGAREENVWAIICRLLEKMEGEDYGERLVPVEVMEARMRDGKERDVRVCEVMSFIREKNGMALEMNEELESQITLDAKALAESVCRAGFERENLCIACQKWIAEARRAIRPNYYGIAFMEKLLEVYEDAYSECGKN